MTFFRRQEEFFVGKRQIVGLISGNPSLEIGIIFSLSVGLYRS